MTWFSVVWPITLLRPRSDPIALQRIDQTDERKPFDWTTLLRYARRDFAKPSQLQCEEYPVFGCSLARGACGSEMAEGQDMMDVDWCWSRFVPLRSALKDLHSKIEFPSLILAFNNYFVAYQTLSVSIVLCIGCMLFLYNDRWFILNWSIARWSTFRWCILAFI